MLMSQTVMYNVLRWLTLKVNPYNFYFTQITNIGSLRTIYCNAGTICNHDLAKFLGLFASASLLWYFDRACRLRNLMRRKREGGKGKREGLAQFANLPFLAPLLSFQKQYILNTYINTFVKLMKYIYWQVQVRLTLCDSFHT